MSVKPSNPFDLDQDELNSMDKILESFESGTEFHRGSVVQATIMDMDDRDVFLDLGRKQDARCARSDFDETPVPGTTVPVVVQSTSDAGLIRVSRREADRLIAWESIREAFEAKAQLHGKIEKPVNHGYIVNHGGVSLFLPMSQADLQSKGRPKFAPGDEIDFRILEMKERHRSAIISRRAVLEERNDASWNELLEKYKPGDEIEGKVAKKVSFGLFVDIGGIEGLLHQTDISWRKFAPFKNRFKIGDSVKLKILSMDRENNRVSLGLKQMTEDPWDWAKRELHVGNNVKGKVLNITDYGAFVEIIEGLEGLIHVSELSWSKKVKHPRKYLESGQEIEARLLAIDPENKRIALGLKQLQIDPWEKLPKEIRVGDILEGEVTSVTKFGAFVKVKDDIEGLVHFSDYSWNDPIDRKLLKKGDSTKFKILEVNRAERRISCGLKQLTVSPYEEYRKNHRRGDVIKCTVARIAPFGVFVNLGDGFEGLIHEKEISLKPDQKLEEAYHPGDSLDAVLLRVDPDTKKIALSVRAFEKKSEREIISQYLKKDDSPSTSSLASMLKKHTNQE